MNKTSQTKSSAMMSPIKYLRQVRQELLRIFWPTPKETIMSGVMVFVMVAISAAFLSLVDWFYSTIIRLLYTVS